jgi:outer membrane protein insertion porin family
VFAFGSNLGYGFGYGGERDLPLFERYFPGGINSVRGYQLLNMGPTNLVTTSLGQQIGRDPIGGSSQLVFNNEIIFPIVESLGLKGVVFVDAGNAFSASAPLDMNEMRVSTGGGIRWLSPIGPLRIEYGIPINRHVGDDLQAVMFSFGGPP